MSDPIESNPTGIESETGAQDVDLTVRPRVDAEISREPDGNFELYWPWGETRLVILLTHDQLRHLASKAIDATIDK